MKENMGFLIFILFIIIFILLLTGGKIIKSIKKAKLKAKKAVDDKSQKYRDETGRQQQQYHYNGHIETPKEEAKPRAEQEKAQEPQVEEPVEVYTKTATGETIIDRRTERESKKIYDNADGEYVEFEEA